MLKFFLFCCLTASTAFGLQAQLNPNGTQFLIQYNEGIGENLRQNIRNYYDISTYSPVNANIELWTELSFPKTVAMPNNTTQTLNTLIDLLEHVEYTSGNGQTVVGAIIHGDDYPEGSGIKEGDINYDINLEDVSLPSGAPFDLLPNCDERVDQRIIHDISRGGVSWFQPFVEVMILDQLIDQRAFNVELFEYPDFPAIPPGMQTGGTHGNEILSIIDNQLTQAGGRANYTNVVLFDENGVCTYDRLLAFFEAFDAHRQVAEPIGALYETKFIMNFSANMLVVPEDQDLILWELWDQYLNDRNVVLVTSVGNQSIVGSDLVYPAAANWNNEISVAGTANCFSTPWVNTNRSDVHYDIAAEAEDIMAFDGSTHKLVQGTSYATALVTGAMAQLMHKCGDYNAVFVRDHLIAEADVVTKLLSTVKDGKVLNLSRAYDSLEECFDDPRGIHGFGGGSFFTPLRRGPTGVTIAPNPFSSTSLVTIPVAHDESASVQLYSTIGQLLLQQDLGESHGLSQFQWELPTNLQPGSYLLRVRVGDEWQQQMVIKQ